MKFLDKVTAAIDPRLGETNRHAVTLQVLLEDLQKALKEKNESKVKEEIKNLREPAENLLNLWK